MHHEREAETKIIYKQKEYKRDNYVAFEFILPSNVSVKASVIVAEEQLNELALQWRKKVKVLKADVHYEGYTKTLMTCQYTFEGQGAQCRLKSK